MKKQVTTIISLFVVSVFLLGMASVATAGHELVGSPKCKSCHKSKTGNQWSIWEESEHAKAFDSSAPISNLLPKENFTDVNNINFSMKLNGETVQQGNTKDMINDIDSLIAFVSQYITLKMGDLIFTGTPKGVGPVKIGDKIEAFIEDEKMLECEIK